MTTITWTLTNSVIHQTRRPDVGGRTLVYSEIGKPVPFYRFDFTFGAAEWNDLRASGTERLSAIDEGLSIRGWELYLFWPSEGGLEAYVVAEGTEPDQVLPALAAAVGGSAAGFQELSVELPDRPTLYAEKFGMVVVAAQRGTDRSCEKCGAAQPPHLNGCPRKRQDELVAAAARARERVH